MAATSAPKPGVIAGVYRNTGIWGTPVWVEVTLVRSATPNFNWDTVDASIRATRAKLYAKTQADTMVTCDVRSDVADAGYQALFDAAMSPSAVLDLLVIDGKLTVEGSRGLRAEFLVNLPSQPQEIDGIIYDSFELKPSAHATNYPQFVEIGSASALTMTAV